MELLGKDRDELKAYCGTLGEPGYRADQIYHWLYAEREFSVERWSNLPSGLREKLGRETTITLPVVRQRYVSSDGSVRYLYGLGDGKKDFTTENTEGTEDKEKGRSGGALKKPAAVEAVFMPSEGRQTICISTQAGCAVDCQFCLTAQLGLIRNLTAGEMVAQVLMPLKEMKERGEQDEAVKKAPAADSDRYIGEEEPGGLAARTNVVLMGQGEPLLNFESVMGALRILLDVEGVGLSPKHVTLSTSGIVPGIDV